VSWHARNLNGTNYTSNHGCGLGLGLDVSVWSFNFSWPSLRSKLIYLCIIRRRQLIITLRRQEAINVKNNCTAAISTTCTKYYYVSVTSREVTTSVLGLELQRLVHILASHSASYWSLDVITVKTTKLRHLYNTNMWFVQLVWSLEFVINDWYAYKIR